MYQRIDDARHDGKPTPVRSHAQLQARSAYWRALMRLFADMAARLR